MSSVTESAIPGPVGGEGGQKRSSVMNQTVFPGICSPLRLLTRGGKTDLLNRLSLPSTSCNEYLIFHICGLRLHFTSSE